jgi:hypothetical protein
MSVLATSLGISAIERWRLTNLLLRLRPAARGARQDAVWPCGAGVEGLGTIGLLRGSDATGKMCFIFLFVQTRIWAGKAVPFFGLAPVSHHQAAGVAATSA